MDNLHFIHNNILTKIFKELTKYKNDSIVFKLYIQELYYISYCIFLSVSMYMHGVTSQLLIIQEAPYQIGNNSKSVLCKKTFYLFLLLFFYRKEEFIKTKQQNK